MTRLVQSSRLNQSITQDFTSESDRIMNETSHPELIDLLPAYALGTLDEAEIAQVSAHLATCPDCQEEVAAFEEVTGVLATAVPIVNPPANLKNRVMAQTKADTSQPSLTASLKQQWQNLWQRPLWQPVLAVACFLVILLGALFIWQQTRTTITDQFVLTPTEINPEAEGLIQVASTGEATLTITNLPPLGAEQQYQLWLIHDGQRDSGAVFSVDEDGFVQVTIDAQRPLTEYGAFGITIEPAGGSPGPTGNRVLGYNL